MYFSVKRILQVLIFTGIMAGEANIVFARWANYDDAEVEIERTTKTLYINRDGTSSNTYEIQAKLLKENGKSSWINYSYPYNSNSTTVEILDAYTLVNGQKHHVNPHKIKKESIPLNLRHLDQQTKIIVPYSNLKIGSIVYLKSKSTDSVPKLNKFYSGYFTFGYPFYTHSESVYITSELPLHISINDPDKVLSINESIKKEKNKTLYCLEVHPKKPIYKKIVDEDNIHFNWKNVPLVSIAAMPTSTYYEKTAAIEYTKAKNQALPELYQEIANIAKTKSTVIDQINTVTTLLSENITYRIHSKKAGSNFLPKSLQEVADTRQGDCKDFSIATCVILQAIGISSKVALVSEGEMELPFPSDLAGRGSNHLIVKVELAEGPLWLDPTHPVSMANHIPPNIANRKALVLHEDYATYEDIPSIKSEDYRVIKYESWDMKNPSQIQIKGTLHLLGGAAGAFTGRRNTLSETAIKEMLLSSMIKNEHEILNYDITLPDLNSRILRNLSFDYSMTVKMPESKTKTSHTIPISFKNAGLFMAKKEAVSSIALGPPRIYESYITLQNIITSLKKEDSDCHLESPWVNLSRTIKYETDKNQVLIYKKMEVKKSWIEDIELVSDAYKQLQWGISQNFTESTPNDQTINKKLKKLTQ